MNSRALRSFSKNITKLNSWSTKRAYISTNFRSLQKNSFVGSKRGGKYKVTLIPGDGIGLELAEAIKLLFKEAKVPVEFEQFNVTGFDIVDDNLFQQSLESLRRNKVGLKGTLYTPLKTTSHRSFNVTLRKELDIYASVALCRNMDGYETRHKDIDFAIIRENTEGEYSGLEHQSFPGVIESLKVTTKEKSERIARFAFDYCLQNNRKKLTCIHKANIMKLGDGLFLNTCRKVAEEYKHSDIKFEDMIVDNASMQLVSRPQQFDVLVTPNLYGNILSNIGAGLVGGAGIVPGANYGREHAIFEPGSRHVGKDIEGKNVANPTSLILSSVMMLKHLSLNEHAHKIIQGLEKVIKEAKVRTNDMGGKHSTSEFTQAVISSLEI